MSPRILGCLGIAVVAAALAFVWTIVAGFGLIFAFVAYSLAGSLVLVGTAALALVFEERPRPLSLRAGPPRQDELLATIRTG